MKACRIVIAGLTLFISVGIQAQQPIQPQSPTAAARPKKTAYYVDPTILNAADLIPDPPAQNSPASQADLAVLHRIEQQRTPQQVAQARADEAEEDMFAFKTVFGPQFTPEALPITAELGVHVKNEQSVIGNQLKLHFERPRPYQVDATLHPVCQVKTSHDSFPSGHALTGYLEALTLAEIVPEKRAEILARADAFAHNRLICGVHYPTDLEASREVAYIVFGYMLATPRFERDLAAARQEMRPKFGFTMK